MKNSYELICEPKEWDSPEIIEYKRQMKRLFTKQEKLEEKYKCVREYTSCGYEINRLKELISEKSE